MKDSSCFSPISVTFGTEGGGIACWTSTRKHYDRNGKEFRYELITPTEVLNPEKTDMTDKIFVVKIKYLQN